MAQDQGGRVRATGVPKPRPDVRALARLIIELALSDVELPKIEADAATSPQRQIEAEQKPTRRSA